MPALSPATAQQRRGGRRKCAPCASRVLLRSCGGTMCSRRMCIGTKTFAARASQHCNRGVAYAASCPKQRGTTGCSNAGSLQALRFQPGSQDLLPADNVSGCCMQPQVCAEQQLLSQKEAPPRLARYALILTAMLRSLSRAFCWTTPPTSKQCLCLTCPRPRLACCACLAAQNDEMDTPIAIVC
jgi:hypothetical protein